MEREVLLDVKDLDVTFGERRKRYEAVKKVNFKIYKGETFGLVGESGSGKTTIGRAIMRIIPSSGGEVIYKGEKINGRITGELDRKVMGEIQMIFQDPQASLNERAKVDYIISEGLMNIEKGIGEKEEAGGSGPPGCGAAAGICQPFPSRVFGRTAAENRYCPGTHYESGVYHRG